MKRIKGRGKGRLQKENAEEMYEVIYSYNLTKRSTLERFVLSGVLENVEWDLGKTLNGAICDLYLEDDGLPRKILVSMNSPFSACTFTSAPGGINWPGI